MIFANMDFSQPLPTISDPPATSATSTERTMQTISNAAPEAAGATWYLYVLGAVDRAASHLIYSHGLLVIPFGVVRSDCIKMQGVTRRALISFGR